MRTEHDLIPDDIADALARSAEHMTDTSRAEVRHAVMRTIRHDTRARYFASISHRVAALAAALSVLGGGVAYATSASLPGDPLYPVKRSAEDVLVAILPPGALERSVLVGVAGHRASEAASLAIEGAAWDLVDSTIDELREAVAEAAASDGPLATEEVQHIESHAQDAPQQTREAISNAVNSSTGTSPSDTDGQTGSDPGTPDDGTTPGSATPGGATSGGSTSGGSTSGGNDSGNSGESTGGPQIR